MTASEDVRILFVSKGYARKLDVYTDYLHTWLERKEVSLQCCSFSATAEGRGLLLLIPQDPCGLSQCVDAIIASVKIEASLAKTTSAKVAVWKACLAKWAGLSYMVVSGNEKCMMSTLLDAAASRIL